MAQHGQHGTGGWSIGPVGSGMEGVNTSTNDEGFVEHNTGSYLEAPASHENHYEHVEYAPSASQYGQQSHGQYAAQHQYSNLGFGVDGQSAFPPHDIRSLGPTQVASHSHSNDYQQPNVPYTNSQNLNFRQFHPQDLVGHYSDYAQSQQHVGVNDFQRNSWAEAQSQHNPSGPYAHGQQLYGNNQSLLRMTAAPSAQPSIPKTNQSQVPYPVDPVSSYQPQVYGGTYQTPQSAEVRQSYPGQAGQGPLSAAIALGKNNAALTQSPGHAAAASHPVSWPPQGPAQRLGSASVASAPTSIMPPSVPRPPTTGPLGPGPKLNAPSTNSSSSNVVTLVTRAGTPGEGWKSLKGCPNLFVGVVPVRRQVVTNTPGVKPHVAGDNRNGTRLLPLIPNLLPCEILREKVRPIVEELKGISENTDKTKEHINAAPTGSEECKRFTEELKKLESRKASLESEKKKITGKAGTLTLEKFRAAGKSEAPDDETETPSSSEEEDPQELIVQQIMASKTRPTDPEKGTQYDVVKIIRNEVTASQTTASQGEKEDPWSKVIGRRVADFGKYVIDICVEAKALREQKSTAPKSQSSQLQTAIDSKYDIVRVALETALEFGDEETLRNMGQHLKLMSSLTIVLSRQFANKTYNTDLPRSILQFFSEATLMDMDVFQKVKLSTILEKHGDNLDDEGKELVALISKNAEERTAKNNADKPAASTQHKQKPLDNAKERETKHLSKTASASAKDSRAADKLQTPQLGSKAVPEAARKETKAYSGLISARKVATNAEKAAARASPSKRPRDDEVDSRATKKVAVESNAGAPGSARAVTASTSNSTASSSSSTTPTNGQLRPRPSGSTVLSKSRAAPKPPVKKPEPQSSMSSTISGLLAEIAKPAEKPKPQEQPVKAPETPEEKSRRLRKEARRGRTVTWKPDDELVQVRFFEHDSTEDEGRASNMIRDARDNRLEGQMLKQMNKKKGDGEEEEGNPTETDIRPWVAPQPIDYSALDDDRREKNYVTRGGTREINSAQKKVMEEYEDKELMTIYTTLSEIPQSPRSPLRKSSEPSVQPTHAALVANDQKQQEVHLRWSEARQYGTTAASQYALRRLGLSSNHVASSTSTYSSARSNSAPAQSAAGAHMMSQDERDARVLALLQSDRARNYVDPDPYDPADPKIIDPPATRDEKVQKAFSIIQNAVDQCRGLPSRPIAPSQGSQPIATNAQSQYSAPQTSHYAAYQTQAQTQPQTQQQPQGYSQLGPQVPDQYAAILRQVQALQNPQAAQKATVPQPTPTQPDNGLANLLAALRGPSQSAQPVQPVQPAQPAQTATQDPTLAAWQAWAQSQAQSYSAQSQAQTYPSYSQQYENTSRDEATYGSHKQEHDSQGQYHRDGGDRGNRKEFNRGAKDHKGINRALIGTKPCSFWAKGQCAKGDNCTFRHDPNDLK
ncbi:hypothetical protein F4859DRAFT_446833 [Xylaria cf. heliscus]|nr:hypothetical protein F4859DRAFT_446833 [Xylaria cf. heliscus]